MDRISQLFEFPMLLQYDLQVSLFVILFILYRNRS